MNELGMVIVLAFLWLVVGVGVGAGILATEADVMEIDFNSHPSLSDQPAVMGEILSPEEELGKLNPIPPVENEPWYPWLSAHEHEPGLAQAVQDAQLATGVQGAAILATLWHESRLMHLDGHGQVLRGDRREIDGKVVWLAIGIAQVHRHPWQQFWSKDIGYEFDLDDLVDNVLACALILKRGGWEDGAKIIRLEAYSYYNTGKHGLVTSYGRKVLATEMEIRGHGSGQ